MHLSPDIDFIFHTVGFILSGLPIAVIAWLVWRTRDARLWLPHIPPFVLFAASYGLGAWGSFWILFGEGVPGRSPDAFFDWRNIFQTTALAALGHIVLRRRWAGLFWLAPLVEFTGLTWGLGDLHPPILIVLCGAAFLAMFQTQRVEARFEWLGMLAMGAAHATSRP